MSAPNALLEPKRRESPMTIVTPSRDDLSDRRAGILRALQTTEAELRAALEKRSLTNDEWAAIENLDAIAFLLGEEPESSE
jgi:hypothetical protein